MGAAVSAPLAARSMAGMHPNEVDARRIARALANRERYRYVSPSVHAVDGGYLVTSPCCSRNIDPDGGVVDVALLLCVDGPYPWLLYRRDHSANEWLLVMSCERLSELLDELNTDPHRLFWQ
jgi:hypothetical protein